MTDEPQEQQEPQDSPPQNDAGEEPVAVPEPPRELTVEEELSLVRQMLEQTYTDFQGQQAFLRQQVGQLHSAVVQLYQAVSAQCQQLLQSDSTLQSELQRFQTGGPQRAMAGVYHKLLRDLLTHLNHLDDLVVAGEGLALDEGASAWLDAIRVARDQFETVLCEWGCLPIPVAAGEDEFDPEVHRAVPAEEGDIPADLPEHRVVRVKRRGWRLHDEILQYPVVVVS